MTAAKTGEGAVIRLDIAGQSTKRHLVLASLGDPSRRADTKTPGVQQGNQHHLRSIRRGTLIAIGGIKLPQIELLHTVPQKPGKMMIFHPLVNGYRQQVELATVGFVKSATHAAFLLLIQKR